jgi:DNA-binding NarL/FixJ family response regulator
MDLLEQERRVFRHQISQELARAVMPIVQRMKERARPSQRREAQFLEAQLNAILATDIDPFWERYSALTPREMELCELLKGGLSSRQVSQTMNVTLATVHKHREQIRRKLGFQHKRVNLSAYLRLHTLPVRT